VKRTARYSLAIITVLAGAGVVAGQKALDRGFGARAEPWPIEEWLARRARHYATPRAERDRRNPVAKGSAVLAAGRAHFADHCAVCHANDGSGRTAFGAAMYPRPPDLRGSASQALSDGEIFSIIRSGIRFTGMPAFGSGPPEADQETWPLVHFIRSLPRITADELTEMEELNPTSRKELREEEEIRRFLAGEAAPTPVPAAGDHRH
jgi:mono/diheme cytochrome c family protein